MNDKKDKQNVCKLQIKDFGEIVTGSTPPTALNKYWKGDFCFYSPSDFSDNTYCNKTEKTITLLGLKQGREIPINSVMVTCIASIGKLAINTKLGITNQQINTIIVNQNFDSKYIYYLLCKNIDQIKNSAAQTSVPIINKTDFGNIELFVNYNKKEQGHIAQILTTCDKVIEQTEAVIAKYKAIKQGMLHDLFTRGLDKNGKLRPTPTEAPELYKKSELGLIPKDWEVMQLRKFAIIHNGIDYKNNPNGDMVPIYGTGGILGYTSMTLNHGPAVLSGRKGSINSPYYVEGDFWNVDTIFCIKTINNNTKWLYYAIEQIDMMKYSEATGVPSITSKTLYNIYFSVPSHQEQIYIVNYISSIENKIQTEEIVLKKYIAIKVGLMKRLLR